MCCGTAFCAEQPAHAGNLFYAIWAIYLIYTLQHSHVSLPAAKALLPARKLRPDCSTSRSQTLTGPSPFLSGHAPLDKRAGGRVYNDDIAWLHVWRDRHSGASLHCAGFVGRGGAVAFCMRLCIRDLQLQGLGQLACFHTKTPFSGTPLLMKVVTSAGLSSCLAGIMLSLLRGPHSLMTDIHI